VAFSGFSIGLNSWARGGRRIEELDARARVERLLGRQLAVASSVPIRVNDQMVPLFRGTNTRVEFISDYSPAGYGEFRKIDYAGDSGRFLYGEKQLEGYAPAVNEPAPTEVLAAFHDIRFRFLAVAKDKNFNWVDEWAPEMGLPAAVEARLDDHSFMVRLVNR
jgi:hypothetical protein